MLATLTEKRFSDKSWIYEKKLDGVRALAFRKGNNIRLLSRNKLSFDNSYPEIVEHLMRTSGNFIIDGEIVALEKGISSFLPFVHLAGGESRFSLLNYFR
jgi:bifunctional non-homologous end joining protein LigD